MSAILKKPLLFIPVAIVAGILFVFTYIPSRCYIEWKLPPNFVHSTRLTWVTYRNAEMNIIFSHPSCWEPVAQKEGSVHFLTLSRWIRGKLYTVFFNFPSYNPAQYADGARIIKLGADGITMMESTQDNGFIGKDVDSGYVYEGTGFDKTYDFHTGTGYLHVSYPYEHSVNGKKQTEVPEGRVIADAVMSTVRIFDPSGKTNGTISLPPSPTPDPRIIRFGGIELAYPSGFEAIVEPCSAIITRKGAPSPRSPYIHVASVDKNPDGCSWQIYANQPDTYEMLRSMEIGQEKKYPGSPRGFGTFMRLPDYERTGVPFTRYLNTNVWEAPEDTKEYVYRFDAKGTEIWIMGLVQYGSQEDQITLDDFDSVISSMRIL